MTITERVLASRLIEKMGSNGRYTIQIGLNGQVIAVGAHESGKAIDQERPVIIVETGNAEKQIVTG